MSTTSRIAFGVFGGTSRRLSVERAANADQLVVEVDVPPMQAQELALSESTKDRCCHECPVARLHRLEKSPNLFAVEHWSLLSCDPWPLAPVECGDRVRIDQAPAHRVRKQSRKRDEDRGNRRVRDAPLTKVTDQRKDVVDSDVVESTFSKQWQDVSLEPTRIGLNRTRPNESLEAHEPVGD